MQVPKDTFPGLLSSHPVRPTGILQLCRLSGTVRATWMHLENDWDTLIRSPVDVSCSRCRNITSIQMCQRVSQNGNLLQIESLMGRHFDAVRNWNQIVQAPHGSLWLRVRCRKDKCFWKRFFFLIYLKVQNELTELAISSNYTQVSSKNRSYLTQKADVSQYCRDCFSSRLWKRSTALIWENTLFQQSMSNLKWNEGRVGDFNEPGNVMHLAQHLWWQSISCNMNVGICVAIHVSCSPAEKEHSFCTTWVSTSTEITSDPLDFFSPYPLPHCHCCAERIQTNATYRMQMREEMANIMLDIWVT